MFYRPAPSGLPPPANFSFTRTPSPKPRPSPDSTKLAALIVSPSPSETGDQLFCPSNFLMKEIFRSKWSYELQLRSDRKIVQSKFESKFCPSSKITKFYESIVTHNFVQFIQI